MTNKPKPSTFSQRLAEARARRGLSHRALARAARISPSLIGAYEKGDISDLKRGTLTKLSAALGVSQSWLTTGFGDMDGPDVPEPPPPKIYGDLPGWERAELTALTIVPELDWAIRGVRRKHVAETPQLLTGAWVAYQAQLYEASKPDEDTRIALTKEAMDTAQSRAQDVGAPRIDAHLLPSSRESSGHFPVNRRTHRD